jgi:hypothetical protein
MMPFVRLSKSRASFLNGEDDAGKRCVKRGREARRCTREEETPLELCVAMRIEAPDLRHHGRADVHGRPLAADRKAPEEADERDDDFSDDHPQTEEAPREVDPGAEERDTPAEASPARSAPQAADLPS